MLLRELMRPHLSRLFVNWSSSLNNMLPDIKPPLFSTMRLLACYRSSMPECSKNEKKNSIVALMNHSNFYKNSSVLVPKSFYPYWTPMPYRSISTFNPGYLCSPTINQVSRMKESHRRKPKKNKRTLGQPQMKGVVLQTFTRKPKKPNSALRKCVALRVKNGKRVIAYVPYGGHSLQEHSVVLIQGGRVQDLPGVRYVCVRGVFDLTWN